MTEKERYELLLDVLTEKIKTQATEIIVQKWQIEELQKKLAEAEYHLNPSPEKAKNLEIR